MVTVWPATEWNLSDNSLDSQLTVWDWQTIKAIQTKHTLASEKCEEFILFTYAVLSEVTIVRTRKSTQTPSIINDN